MANGQPQRSRWRTLLMVGALVAVGGRVAAVERAAARPAPLALTIAVEKSEYGYSQSTNELELKITATLKNVSHDAVLISNVPGGNLFITELTADGKKVEPVVAYGKLYRDVNATRDANLVELAPGASVSFTLKKLQYVEAKGGMIYDFRPAPGLITMTWAYRYERCHDERRCYQGSVLSNAVSFHVK